MGENGKDLRSHMTRDGVLHLFWRQDNATSAGIIYRTQFSNGSVINWRKIELNNAIKTINGLSTQISDNGKHILIAYQGYRVKPKAECNGIDTDSCDEIFFMESGDGGESWSRPIRMNRVDMNDVEMRTWPTMLLEKDTGRVYIVYGSKKPNIRDYNLIISVKQPGKQSFDLESVHPRRASTVLTSLGYTIDKATSRRYVHLFWKTREDLYYTRSVDNGVTWSTDKTIGKNGMLNVLPVVAINAETLEGGLYVQYGNRDMNIIWSRDHGDTFNQPLRVGSISMRQVGMELCGCKTNILFFADLHYSSSYGHLRFLYPYEKNLITLPYPFSSIYILGTVYPKLICVPTGADAYSLTFIIENPRRGYFYLAHGVLKDNPHCFHFAVSASLLDCRHNQFDGCLLYTSDAADE
eukprot:TRINITY_DN17040_c0_g1_i3.p1 TRINITY_DN17040_c0_g1~~TRINITY_DN17040_c0_g1_i3.p1  ORF type:complete len:409 (+),score=27.83 TRINITY_DN17040_c0_g1_i3:138-1364(+)